MLYPINIYVFDNGNKLDVNQEETIEINMGGISLLNLQQRTCTHTNSFSLPRTPNNEKELGYIGLKQVYATPRVEVIIQRGSINLRGFITVLNTTEKAIEVSFAYDDGGGFADLKNMNFYTVYDETYPEFEDNSNGEEALLRYITAMPVGTPDEKLYYAPHTAGGMVTAYDRDSENSGGLVIRFLKFIGLLESELGITIEGKANIPSYLWVVNKWAGFGVQYKYANKIQPFVSLRQNIGDNFLSVSDVLKAFCQYNNLDFVQTSYNTFEFKSFTTILKNAPYVIEQDILEWQKRTTTGLAKYNDIVYKNNGRALATLLGNGKGRKELFKSLVSAPARQSFPTSPMNAELTGYNLLDCPDVIFLSNTADPAYPENYYTIDKYYVFLTGSGGTQYYKTLTINYPELKIAPVRNYYTIQQALQYPIIFDVTIWLSNYDFEQVCQKRMVRSVVLGGDFFVEKMAYNVNTGNAVLTLIKKW